VPLGPRRQVVTGLAKAIRYYDENRETLLAHGRTAREVILRDYDWDRKGEQMNECYQEAVARHQAARAVAPAKAYTGMGGMTNLLHSMFSMKAMGVSLLGLILIGMLGFLSVGHLKKQAWAIVFDTMPGLFAAGQANASLAQGFNRTLLALQTDSPEQRAQLRKEITELTEETATNLDAYKASIFESEDQLMFDRLVECRLNYIGIREKALA
jgi:hypothetical protein